MKTAFLIMIGLIAIGLAGVTTICPCGPMPGLWLSGDTPNTAVTDWTFVNDRELAPLCQVQITTWRPHSINLNCMAVAGDLYISCSRCEGKSWSNSALQYPNGKIRANGTVYPVTLRRVYEPAELDRAWLARLAKIQADPAPRPDHWWTFQLTRR